jgi:hypothetical protein
LVVIDFEELWLSSGVHGGNVEGLKDIIVKDSDESKKDSEQQKQER